MVRRIASQVHKQIARLLRADYLKREPAWYKAVLEHPPLPLPPRVRPLPIHYIEDDVRRQFFRDHPFEAFRPVTLVEGAGVDDAHPVRGATWTKLRQRGRNPTPEEYVLTFSRICFSSQLYCSAIRFAVNLYQHHDMPLSEAYAKAIAQFRSLRSEHHIANVVAVQEAECYGSVFGPTEIEVGFSKEKKALETWERREELDEGAIAARKRWRAIIEKQGPSEWTKGQEYVKLWKKGIRPTYAPVLTEPVIDHAGLSTQGSEGAVNYFQTLRDI
jgi:small subunit ribosomal protein S23